MKVHIDKCNHNQYIQDNLCNEPNKNVEIIYNINDQPSCINLGLNPLMSNSNLSTPLQERPCETIFPIKKPQHIGLLGSNVTIVDNPIE